MLSNLIRFLILFALFRDISTRPKGKEEIKTLTNNKNNRQIRSTDPNTSNIGETMEAKPEDEIWTAIVVNQLVLGQLSKMLDNIFRNSSEEKFGQRQKKDCPSPFFRVNSECFYIHQNPKMDWMRAAGFCQRLGGDLVEPETVELLQAVLLQRPKITESQFWIGATDQNVEREWKWTSGSLVDLLQSAWYRGEPNNHGGNEDCLQININRYPTLNDEECYSRKAFICEYLVGA